MWDLFISIFVNVLIWIYDVVGHNFGLAIILFTILILAGGVATGFMREMHPQ